MMRRIGCGLVHRSLSSRPLLQTKTVVESRRHLEPMSVWYLASWTCVWWYAFFFWMPVLYPDLMAPSFVYNKIPVIHFLHEKRAEQKLRRLLDETSTEWSSELDAAAVTDAIARTF